MKFFRIWRFVGASHFSNFHESFQRISVVLRCNSRHSFPCIDKAFGSAFIDCQKYSVLQPKACSLTSIFSQGLGVKEDRSFSGISINARIGVTDKQSERSLVDNEDVSPSVHMITGIIREKNHALSMEDSLKECGISFTPNIVEKVLKRCFKVCHLALRFFKWVGLQPGFKHTCDTYNVMIYIAGEAKEFACVKQLLEDMDRDLCPKTVKTWTIVIGQYGKANLIAEALQAFTEMKNSAYRLDKIAYNSIIRILCCEKSIDLAHKLYKQMLSENLTPDLPVYILLMTCFCKKENLLEARVLGDEMLKIAHLPEQVVYSCLLKGFCVAGRIEAALELIHEIKERGLMPDHEIFCLLVKGLCRTGKMQDAIQLVDVMKKQDCPPDENIYGNLVDGYLRAGQVNKALGMLDTMKDGGCLPTVSSYTAVIQHLFRLNEFEEACRLFEEMQEHGHEPDVVAITAMVAGQVGQGHVFEAWQIFNAMKNKGVNPTWKAYSVFIKELCKAGRSEEACQLLDEMEDRNINPGAQIFQRVVSSLKREGKKDRAEEVMSMNRTYKLVQEEKKEVHCEVDRALNVESQRLDEAGRTLLKKREPKQLQSSIDFKLKEQLERDYDDCDFQKICGILLNSDTQCRMEEALQESGVAFTPSLVKDILQNCQGHGNAALRFFSWVGQQSGYRHTTETFNLAIKIAGSAKDFRYMRGLFEEMRREDCPITADTWTVIVTQYGRAGLTNIALKKFEEMKGDNCRPNANTYKYLTVFLCGKKGRNLKMAIEIFQEMLCVGFMPDKSLSDLFLTTLCEEGKLLDARKCVDSLKRRKCFTDQIIYSMLLKGFCRAGKMSEALELVDEMKNEGCITDQYVYGTLVHGLLRVGQLSKALETLETMRHGGYLPTVHIYTALIIHFFRERKSEQAFQVFEEMKKNGCKPTIITYSALIRGYMNEGLISNAWDTFNLMKEKGPAPDFKTYSTFMLLLCKAGKSKGAMKLLYDMMETGIHPSAMNFKTVFFGLNREGKRDEAQSVMQAKWALSRRRKYASRNMTQS